MVKTTQINKEVSIGPQPEKGDLEELQSAGFKTVINLRVPHEEPDQLAPEDEGEQVRELGMNYLHIPVTMKQIRPEQVEEFCHALEVLEKPAFVHCKAATRAGIFALLQAARQQGWSAQKTLAEGHRLGINLDRPEIAAFVKEFVES